MITEVGDIAQFVSPMVALVTAEDPKDFLYHYLATIGVSFATKELGQYTHFKGSRRPDRSDYRGMPSGHTASAAIGAAYSRNPWLYGVTVVTGYSRIAANKHNVWQVLAGVALAEVVMLESKLIFTGNGIRIKVSL